MRPLITPCHGALLRAIRRVAGRDVIIERLSGEAWASITFAGERHRLELRIEGAGAAEAGDRLAAQLSEAELEVPGHIVADVALVERRTEHGAAWLAFEILTVAD